MSNITEGMERNSAFHYMMTERCLIDVNYSLDVLNEQKGYNMDNLIELYNYFDVEHRPEWLTTQQLEELKVKWEERFGKCRMDINMNGNLLTFENVRQGHVVLKYEIDEQLARLYHYNTGGNPAEFDVEQKNNAVIKLINEFVHKFSNLVTEDNAKLLDARLQDYNKLIVVLYEEMYAAAKIPEAYFEITNDSSTDLRDKQWAKGLRLEDEIYGIHGGRRHDFEQETDELFSLQKEEVNSSDNQIQQENEELEME